MKTQFFRWEIISHLNISKQMNESRYTIALTDFPSIKPEWYQMNFLGVTKMKTNRDQSRLFYYFQKLQHLW